MILEKAHHQGPYACLYRNPPSAPGRRVRRRPFRITEAAIAARDFSWSLSDIIFPTTGHRSSPLQRCCGVCFQGPHHLAATMSWSPASILVARDNSDKSLSAGRGGDSATTTSVRTKQSLAARREAAWLRCKVKLSICLHMPPRGRG